MYWASLALFDPVAAVLLFVRSRAGLILCLAIIITDVANNSWVRYLHSSVDLNYILEVAFLVFVLATFKYAWQGLPQRLGNTSSSAGGSPGSGHS
jgi:hypothetical protein